MEEEKHMGFETHRSPNPAYTLRAVFSYLAPASDYQKKMLGNPPQKLEDFSNFLKIHVFSIS